MAPDPHVHGVLSPAQLAGLEATGQHVHRVGRAAYVHGPTEHCAIFGVWSPRETPPAWEPKLRAWRLWFRFRGPAPAPEARRAEAWSRARRHLRLRGPSGRFVSAVPWWAEVDAVGRLLTPRSAQPWRLR